MDTEERNKSVWNEPFFMFRKVNKCYSNAISFFTDRFWKIIKLALPILFLGAFGITVILYVLCYATFQISFASSLFFCFFAIIVILFTLSIVISFLYRCIDVNIESINLYSVGYKYIYNKIFFNRLLKAFIVVLVAFIIIALIGLGIYYINKVTTEDILTYEHVLVKTWILGISGSVLLMVVLLPLFMSLNTVMYNKKHIWFNLWNGYKLGWKKWGRVFALDFLITITISVLFLFVMAPAYVISLMQHSATLSRMQGDVVDIPFYFPWITALILFMSSMFLIILILMKFMPQAYLYASFVSEEKDEINNK